MQEWKMTDKNYGVWKMQDWKMTDKLAGTRVYVLSVLTLRPLCPNGCPLCRTPIDMDMRVYFYVYLAKYRKTLLELD